MRKIFLILILILTHGSQLKSATIETNEYWDFAFNLNKEIRTKKSHTEMLIQFYLIYGRNGASGYYEERETILGSINPTVTETTFNKTIDITKQEADTFISKLDQAGFLNLPESKQITSKESDLFWYEKLTLRTGDREIERSYKSPPREGIRADVNEIVFSFIDDMRLNKPNEPLRIEAFIKGETGLFLSLELSEPLWNPIYYHGKKIESMIVYEEKGIRKTIINIVDKNSQTIATWNATIPDSNEELTSYEGQAAYEGKTIEDILINTKITNTEGDSEPSRKVTLQEILDDPDKYHGKRICTKGFFDFQYESMDFHDRRGNNLWIGERSSFAKMKRIIFPIPSFENIIGRHRGYATVEGVFLKGPAGHFGFWPGEIVRLTRFDAHFKLDYIFWLGLLAIVLVGVFVIKIIRKRIQLKTSNKIEDSHNKHN